MDAQIQLSIGTLMAVIGFITGAYMKIKKDILRDAEQLIDSKVDGCIAAVKKDISDIKLTQTEMNVNIEWIKRAVQKMNGNSHG